MTSRQCIIGSRHFEILKMRPLRCLETSDTDYSATRRHILEEGSPWCISLLQAVSGTYRQHQSVRFPAFYGTLAFVALSTIAHHRFFWWTRLIQYTSSIEHDFRLSPRSMWYGRLLGLPAAYGTVTADDVSRPLVSLIFWSFKPLVSLIFFTANDVSIPLVSLIFFTANDVSRLLVSLFWSRPED